MTKQLGKLCLGHLVLGIISADSFRFCNLYDRMKLQIQHSVEWPSELFSFQKMEVIANPVLCAFLCLKVAANFQTDSSLKYMGFLSLQFSVFSWQVRVERWYNLHETPAFSLNVFRVFAWHQHFPISLCTSRDAAELEKLTVYACRSKQEATVWCVCFVCIQDTWSQENSWNVVHWDKACH